VVDHPFLEGVVVEVVHLYQVVGEAEVGQPSLVEEEAVVGQPFLVVEAAADDQSSLGEEVVVVVVVHPFLNLEMVEVAE